MIEAPATAVDPEADYEKFVWDNLNRNYAAHFAFIDYIFGTAVKSDRRFPGKYGVLGDYMPTGFVRQQLFPFTWKG